MKKARVEYKPASPEPRHATKVDQVLRNKSAYSDPSRPSAGAGYSSPRAPKTIGIPKMTSISRSLNRSSSFGKSVTLGQSFQTPVPMPFRDDGLPDWDAPTLGSYVSFTLENGPLKGRVVVLKRRENGMYVIAEDDHSAKNPADRDKDKSKLSKENNDLSHMNHEAVTEATQEDLDQLNELADITQVAKSAAWTRKEGKNPRGGLNARGRASARAEGHNLKPPVKSGTTLSDIKRRYSFLSRMGGMPGPERDENGKPTRLLLSLQAWGASSKADAKAKAAMLKRRIERMEGSGVHKAQGGRELTPEQIAARNAAIMARLNEEQKLKDAESQARWNRNAPGKELRAVKPNPQKLASFGKADAKTSRHTSKYSEKDLWKLKTATNAADKMAASEIKKVSDSTQIDKGGLGLTWSPDAQALIDAGSGGYMRGPGSKKRARQVARGTNSDSGTAAEEIRRMKSISNARKSAGDLFQGEITAGVGVPTSGRKPPFPMKPKPGDDIAAKSQNVYTEEDRELRKELNISRQLFARSYSHLMNIEKMFKGK